MENNEEYEEDEEYENDIEALEDEDIESYGWSNLWHGNE